MPGAPESRAQRRDRRNLGLEILSLPLLLGIWQSLAMVFPNRLFPTPVEVGADLVELAIHGKLLADLGKTLARAAVSFCVAMVVGSVLGIAFGRIRWLDRLFSTWVVVGLNLPAIVIAIVLYIWLGLTETALIIAVIVNKIPLVITNIREGVRSFSRDYDELAAAFRMPLERRLRLIFVPQLMPFVLAAARTGLSLIWKIVLVFEVLGSDGGVGFRVSVLFQFFDITGILAYTTAFILVVLAFEYLVMRPLERKVLRWRPVPGISVRIGEKRFAGAKEPLFADLALDIAASSVTSLLGPSGVGKSSLLRMIGGIDTDFSGTITVGGVAAAEAPPSGFVLQDARLLPWLTAIDNIRAVAPHAPRNQPLELLDRVGLHGYAGAFPHELSGGMQRRVALARAFSVNSNLLLLDEPFVSLDRTLVGELQELFLRLVESERPTVVLVTHLAEDAERLSDRCVVLGGRPARIVSDIPMVRTT